MQPIRCSEGPATRCDRHPTDARARKSTQNPDLAGRILRDLDLAVAGSQSQREAVPIEPTRHDRPRP